MPLRHGQSRQDFVDNLKTELTAGKPRDQSLAIAYSEQRRSSGDKSSAKRQSYKS
jgi:hypothetical protein